MKPSSEVTLELFQAGTWNGWTFTSADLDRIIANAEALQPYIKPRLVLGHTKRSEQPEVGRMEQPCVGQLKPGSLRRVGSKLLGTFSHVPDVVQRAMSENLYAPTSVSIEAYPQFRDTRIARELEANVPGFIAPSGPVLCAAALLGASSLPAVKTLADLRAYLSENHDAISMGETLAERVAAAENRFAELRGERAELERRLARLRRPPIATFAQERTSSTMSTNQNQSFRAQVDDRVAANGADITDKSARLQAARQLLRELADAGEEVVSTEEYVASLQPKTGATTGWNGWNVNVSQAPGGLGGLNARVSVFGEKPAARTSTDVHREADRLAAEGHAPHYGRTASRVAPIPPELSSIVSAMHEKLGRDPDRLGHAWREAVRRAPKSLLPRYGVA